MAQQFNTCNSLEELYLTGIYYILNTVNNKFYIGSTAKIGTYQSNSGFYSRWYAHVWELRKNSHENPKLQNAWNKYGEDSFKFQILEFVEPDKCLEVEQVYLDLFPEGDRDLVYNISFIAGRSFNLGQKHTEEARQKMSRSQQRVKRGREFYLISPSGEEVIGFNLKAFCRDNNLDNGSITHVLSGNLTNHKGWTKDFDTHLLYKESFALRGLTRHNPGWRVQWYEGENKIPKSKKCKDLVSAIGLRDKLIEEGYIFKNTRLNRTKKADSETEIKVLNELC
jgi:group I intron endonuclease